MADDQKPAGPSTFPPIPPAGSPKADSPRAEEVSATDLLSLWGKPPASSPKPVSPPPPSVPRPMSPPPVPPKLSSTPPAAPLKPLPSREAPKPSPPPPAPKPPPAQKPLEALKPPEPKKPQEPKKPTKEVYEGEIVSAPKKTPAALPDGRQAPSEAEPEFLQEKEGFGSQLDEFLAELNLSRRHIIYGVGCLVILAGLVFGGITGYRVYKNRKQTEAPPLKPPTQISTEETGIPAGTQVGQSIVVTKEMVGDTGLWATIATGQTEEIKTDIAYYIMTFRRLQNAYQTNINDLLNQTTDRRAKLRSHLAVLKKLDTDGTQLLAQMKSEIEKIKQEYEPPRKLQETTDVNFFEQLNAFNAQTASDILDDFIEASKQVVAFRARFKALQKVAAFYEEGLPKIEARIRDIELNEEPLVSGIRVYDVKGSDLKLIIPVNGAQTENERLSTPSAFPLIPVNPADIKSTGGRDFITQPGGGF